ncbi:hypothetical protein DV736_g3880, partial [Chaetothyriales sp. CBS 134916]
MSETPTHDSQPITSACLHSLHLQADSFIKSASPQQLDALESFLRAKPVNTHLQDLYDLQQQVASFFLSAPRQQLDALGRFLTTQPVPVSKTTNIMVIPPADEVEIRLGHARRLQRIIREENETNNWQFTASNLSTILIMPMDILSNLASSDRILGFLPAESALRLAADLSYECQIFEVKFDGKDSKEDAEKMKNMVDLQWALIVMASIAGAADPPELDDSDNGDLDDGAMEVDPGTMYDDEPALQLSAQ